MGDPRDGCRGASAWLPMGGGAFLRVDALVYDSTKPRRGGSARAASLASILGTSHCRWGRHAQERLSKRGPARRDAPEHVRFVVQAARPLRIRACAGRGVGGRLVRPPTIHQGRVRPAKAVSIARSCKTGGGEGAAGDRRGRRAVGAAPFCMRRLLDLSGVVEFNNFGTHVRVPQGSTTGNTVVREL